MEPLAVVFLVIAPLAIIALGLWTSTRLAKLLAVLQYRHSDLWVGLGRPTFPSAWRGIVEEYQARFATFRFIRRNRREPLDDPEVNRLCRHLCIGYSALYALAAAIVIGVLVTANRASRP